MEANTSTNTTKDVINQGRPVYISYAGNSSIKPEWEHIADAVEKLKATLEAEGIEYCTRDITSGDKISDFERQIGDGEVIIIVFSDLYFRTEHCMYEFSQIKESLKKDPDKKLICIKNGTFDLSNTQYILELERLWGNKRQEYSEIEFHQMRQFSEQEQAAHGKGFYIDDIRRLYSFFSSLNYLNMAVADWKAVAADISAYYKRNPANKSKKKRKPMSLTTKIFISGVSAALLTAIVWSIILECKADNSVFVVEYPSNKQNDYFQEGGILKRILCLDTVTILNFSFPNNCKDTMPFSKDDGKMILVEKLHGIIYDEYKVLDVKVDQSGDERNNTIGGDDGATTDFTLTYPVVMRNNNVVLDFKDGDKGIYEIRIPPKHLVSVEHPEYDRGTDNCYVYKIDIDKKETKLYFRLVNKSDKDSLLYVLDDYYIYANGKKYKLDNAVGIPVYPNKTTIAKGASMNFALIFPPIPSTTEFIHFVGGNWKIYGLKVQRDNLYEVFHPKYENVDTTINYKITKIEVNSGETVVHIRYHAKQGCKNQLRMPHDSYIVAEHTKYALKGSSGLPSTPDSTITWLDFALIYPPIPADSKRMDCILYEDYDTMDIIGFYGIDLNN